MVKIWQAHLVKLAIETVDDLLSNHSKMVTDALQNKIQISAVSRGNGREIESSTVIGRPCHFKDSQVSSTMSFH